MIKPITWNLIYPVIWFRCLQCKELAPIWKELAANISTKKNSVSSIAMADCSMETELCSGTYKILSVKTVIVSNCYKEIIDVVNFIKFLLQMFAGQLVVRHVIFHLHTMEIRIIAAQKWILILLEFTGALQRQCTQIKISIIVRNL